jgi:hypothetical protein
VDQIDYAMTWVIAHHPDTGSFSRVAHFGSVTDLYFH